MGGRAGGIPPIIAGMHAHPTHSGTQGGLALGNLASLCTANRKLIAHAGGIPAICKSMKTNLQFPGVQEYGCWALRHLALDPECKHCIARGRAADHAARNARIPQPHRGSGAGELRAEKPSVIGAASCFRKPNHLIHPKLRIDALTAQQPRMFGCAVVERAAGGGRAIASGDLFVKVRACAHGSGLETKRGLRRGRD